MAKKVSLILLIIAYISIIAEGFLHSISDGLIRLALCSLCFIIPFSFLLNDYSNKKMN